MIKIISAWAFTCGVIMIFVGIFGIVIKRVFTPDAVIFAVTIGFFWGVLTRKNRKD